MRILASSFLRVGFAAIGGLLAASGPASGAVCDDELYARIPLPTEFTSKPGVQPARTEYADDTVVGGRVALQSTASVAAWRDVLEHPERQAAWLPEQFGVSRTERLDSSHVFEQLELSFLLGAVKARRQLLIEFEWRMAGSAFEACWALGPSEPFAAQVAPWVTDAPWETVGLGRWHVEPRDDGGSNVSYDLWTKSDILPAIQAWAVSRTLPDLVRAFDARANLVSRAP